MAEALIIGYGILFDDADQVLLLRRRSTEDLWPQRWWLPGDMTPLDEEPDATVPRIFEHLLRQQVRVHYLQTVYGSEPQSGRHTVHNGYLVSVLEALDPQPQDETNPFDSIQWFDPAVALAELPEEQAALLATAVDRRAQGWTPEEDITLESLFDDVPDRSADDTHDHTHEQRRQAGAELLAEVTGQADIAASLQQSLGPFGDYLIDHVWGDVWQDGLLSRRDRSLAACAAAGALRQHDGFAFNARIAERHDVTRDELVEICLQLAVECGFPYGNEALTRLLADWRRADPDFVLPPAAAKDDDQRRSDAAAIVSLLHGRAFSAETIASDAQRQLGQIGRLTVEWALGDIWSRRQLAARDRALVVTVIHIAIGRERELEADLRTALRLGLNADELDGAISIASVFCGLPRASDAARMLRRIRQERD